MYLDRVEPTETHRVLRELLLNQRPSQSCLHACRSDGSDEELSLEQVPPIAFSEAVLDLADVLVEQDAR